MTTKTEIIKVMNELIKGTNDENIYEYWANYVPDQADETDFQEIAEDKELFDTTVNAFIRLSRHFKEGINLNGTWYKGQIKIYN